MREVPRRPRGHGKRQGKEDPHSEPRARRATARPLRVAHEQQSKEGRQDMLRRQPVMMTKNQRRVSEHSTMSVCERLRRAYRGPGGVECSAGEQGGSCEYSSECALENGE